MSTIHSTNSLQVVHLIDPHILYCNWFGPQTEQSVKESGAVILDIQRTHHFAKILNDNTQVTGSWRKASQWTAEQWFPDMIHAGLQHFAWIFPADVFAEISAKRALPPGDIVTPFTNYQDAYNWLVSIH
jgi:hypothetical protein